jgi:hypothetical protein
LWEGETFCFAFLSLSCLPFENYWEISHAIFVLVIKFLGVDWEPKHTIIGLFAMIETN